MVYILKNMNLFDMSPFKEKNDAFKRLLDVANLNAMTPHERAVYDENLKGWLKEKPKDNVKLQPT